MSPRHRKLLPWIALCVIYVVWGSTYMAIRIVVREVPPMAAASLRFMAAGLVMAAIAARVDRGQARPTRRRVFGQRSRLATSARTCHTAAADRTHAESA